jgi:ABC-type transport system substrate-binding protein
VTFHDGSKLTAEDVAFSVKRITDGLCSPQRGQFDKIVAAVPVSETEVKLVTDGPYPALLAQLVKLSIVPKVVVEKIGNDAFNLKPVGSGPYRFESWQRGVAVTLKRNDGYWGTKGPFPTVLFRAVPDGATRVANLQAGSSDLAVGLDSDQLAQFKTSQRVKPLTALTERLAYLRLNPNRPPFDNPKIREAVARAVDKQGIIDGILGGQEKPIGQMLTPAHFGWAEGISGPGYDPARAKALVAEAGAAGKVPFALTTAPFFDQRVVQAIQQQLRDVGLDVTIEMIDTPSFLQRTQRGPVDSPVLPSAVLPVPARMPTARSTSCSIPAMAGRSSRTRRSTGCSTAPARRSIRRRGSPTTARSTKRLLQRCRSCRSTRPSRAMAPPSRCSSPRRQTKACSSTACAGSNNPHQIATWTGSEVPFPEICLDLFKAVSVMRHRVAAFLPAARQLY